MKKLKYNSKLRNTLFAITLASTFATGFFCGSQKNAKIKFLKGDTAYITQQDTLILFPDEINALDSIENTIFSPKLSMESRQKLPSAKKFFSGAKNGLHFSTFKGFALKRKERLKYIESAKGLNNPDSLELAYKKYQETLKSGFAYIKSNADTENDPTSYDYEKLKLELYTNKSLLNVMIRSGAFSQERINQELNKCAMMEIIQEYRKHQKEYNQFVSQRIETEKQDSAAFETDKRQKIDSLNLQLAQKCQKYGVIR